MLVFTIHMCIQVITGSDKQAVCVIKNNGSQSKKGVILTYGYTQVQKMEIFYYINRNLLFFGAITEKNYFNICTNVIY